MELNHRILKRVSWLVLGLLKADSMGVEGKIAHWTQMLLLEQTTVAGVKKNYWG